jgi:UDP-N-acetylmuramoylalanine--D-glutamate ligase
VTAPRQPIVYGFANTGQSMTRALLARGHEVVVVDDHPSTDALAAAELIGMEVVERPSRAQLSQLLVDADALLPSPGIPDAHPVFDLAAENRVAVLSEFDLAREWDDRPIVAITGTDGKTTVTSLVTEMLERSGRRAVAAGNDALPLVEAIDRSDTEVFVVEASSFRLGHTAHFTPKVATWLNFAPDHLDVHRSLEAYEAAKARIWAELGDGDVAVANADDAVVMRNRNQTLRATTYATERDADYHVADGQLVGPDGPLMAIAELWRDMPHDVSNALAAAATAIAGGAQPDAVVEVLRSFHGLPHRVELVGEWRGVRWVDDSKATVPHATLAAVRAFDSVVLIAGGRNKGLDLAPLAEASDRIRAVVAIGEAAGSIEEIFAGRRPVERADHNIDEAVAAAHELAEAGDVVLLSPGCASFDWFESYRHRGEAFRAAVHRRFRSADAAPDPAVGGAR